MMILTMMVTQPIPNMVRIKIIMQSQHSTTWTVRHEPVQLNLNFRSAHQYQRVKSVENIPIQRTGDISVVVGVLDIVFLPFLAILYRLVLPGYQSLLGQILLLSRVEIDK